MNVTKSVVIVGVGALGSHAALLLRHEDLTVVDMDRVEAKNCLSQLHPVGAIGRNKAQTVAEVLGNLYSRRVTSRPVRLTASNVNQLLARAGLVVDCTDNAAARRLVNGFTRENGIPCLHVGISADGSFARIIWAEMFEPDEADGDGATCEDGANLAFHGLVGAQVAVAAQLFLRDGKRHGFFLTKTRVERVS